MANYLTIITNLGAAKIAAALANGSNVNISQMAVGDGMGNATTPDPTQTALVREVYRANLNSLTRDPNNANYIIAEMDIPANVGGWTVREFGLFDNAGALIAVGNYPDSYKPTLDQNSARDMIVRAIIQVSDAANVILNVDPSLVLASRQWVAQNYALSILLPGGTTGDVEWYDPAAGVNVILDVVEEDQTLAAGQAVVNLATATTEGVAVYINGERLRKDQFTINSSTQFTLATAATGGEKLLAVQNEPAGNSEFLRTQQNLADLRDKPTARQNLGLDDPAYQQGLLQALLQFQYPVGEIYVTRRNGDPSALLGFGTWQRYGAGRVLASLDPNDSAFNAVDLEGGEKAHALSNAELPAHVHTVGPITGNTGGQSATHTHNAPLTGDSGYSGGGKWSPLQAAAPSGATPATGIASNDHTHPLTIAQFNTGAVGSSAAHNKLPPYKVVNVWIRTA